MGAWLAGHCAPLGRAQRLARDLGEQTPVSPTQNIRVVDQPARLEAHGRQVWWRCRVAKATSAGSFPRPGHELVDDVSAAGEDAQAAAPAVSRVGDVQTVL